MPPDEVKISHDGRIWHIAGHRGGAGFLDILKWQFGSRPARWPRRLANSSHPPPPARVEGGAMSATWIGHSTVLVQTAGLNILTDPFLSERASPLAFAGPRRVRPAALKADELPPIDLILLSHNHYDHMDLPALRAIARHHRPKVITPHGNARRLPPTLDVTELGWHDSIAFGTARIHLTPALHWSKRGLFDANRALWGAFLIETPGGSVYFAGDTGFGEGITFSAIRSLYGSPRLSLLPVGAYEPRWFMKAHHMNPDDAVEAHLRLASQTSLAIHHSTIQLTNEAITAPVEALHQALEARAVDPQRFLVPDVGETVAIP